MKESENAQFESRVEHDAVVVLVLEVLEILLRYVLGLNDLQLSFAPLPVVSIPS